MVSDVVGKTVNLYDQLKLPEHEGVHVGGAAMDALPLLVGEPAWLLVSVQDPTLVTLTVRPLLGLTSAWPDPCLA